MYLKTRKFPCVRAHIGNLINYMRTDTKDLLTNRFGGNEIKQYVCAVIVFLEFLGNYFLHSYRRQKFRAEETLVSLYRNKSFLSGKQRF